MIPLKDHYIKKVVPELKEKLGLQSIMAVPKVTKVTLNMGVGEAMNDKKLLEKAVEDLTLISGQKPQITKARKSVANFKLREGMPIESRTFIVKSIGISFITSRILSREFQ